jgi:hypothetical protein
MTWSRQEIFSGLGALSGASGFLGLTGLFGVVQLDKQEIPVAENNRPHPRPYGCFLVAIRVFFDANWGKPWLTTWPKLLMNLPDRKSPSERDICAKFITPAVARLSSVPLVTRRLTQWTTWSTMLPLACFRSRTQDDMRSRSRRSLEIGETLNAWEPHTPVVVLTIESI